MVGGGDALRRVRWRRRGAWVWPTFVVAVAGEGVLMHVLPISGDRTPFVGAALLAGVLNLLAVAVLAPVAAVLVRRRRPDLPVVVARDYAGTWLIVALGGLIALLAVGNRGQADAERRAFAEQAMAARHYVLAQAPAVYRRRIDQADTAVVDRNLFRTCVPAGDRGPWLCVFVDTSEDPPGVTVDPSRASNSTFVDPAGAGPGG